MAAQVTTVVEIRKSVEPYTGENGADIVAAIPGATLVSETGGILTIGHNNVEYPLAVGEVIQFRESNSNIDVFWPISGMQHSQIYRPLVEA